MDLVLHQVQHNQDVLEALELDPYSLVQDYLELHYHLWGLQQHKQTCD